MNIKKVAVLGAGAVGSYVIWGLSNNKNITLGVVADGERNERLKTQGLMITEQNTHRKCGLQKKHTMWIF